MRMRLWQQCEQGSEQALLEQACGHSSCDGAFSLQLDAPLWSVFSAFTLSRNEFQLHTETDLPPLRGSVASARCAQQSRSGAFCTFAARVGKKSVSVSLVADDATIVVPQWAAGMSQVTLNTDDGFFLLDLYALDLEHELSDHKDIFDDDDDVSRTTRSLGSLNSDRATRAVVRAAGDANSDEFVLGTAILASLGVRRSSGPMATVEFFHVNEREHLSGTEALLQSFLFTHFVALVCRSTYEQTLFISSAPAYVRSPVPPRWLEIFSLLCTLVAAFFSLSALSAGQPYVDSPSRLATFIAVQSVAGILFAFILFPLGASDRRRPREGLAQSAASEQVVLMAMLLLALSVRESSTGSTFGAVFVAFLVVANCTRNVYLAISLIVTGTVRNAHPRTILLFVVFIGQQATLSLLHLGVIVVYPVVGSAPLTLLVTVSAVALGQAVVDIYRESAYSGQTASGSGIHIGEAAGEVLLHAASASLSE